MARSCPHQPPVPSPVERARATVVGAGGAALLVDPQAGSGDGDGGRVLPVLHHVPASGAAALQLPADHPLVGLRHPGEALLPLAVDRLGLRLRVETDDGDHDVRIGFAAPVACPRALGAEVRRLAEVSPAAPAAGRRRAAER